MGGRRLPIVTVCVVAGLALASACSPSSPVAGPTRTTDAASVSTTTMPALSTQLLALSDLPAGWMLDGAIKSTGHGSLAGCPGYDSFHRKAKGSAEVGFDEGRGVPYLEEYLGTFAHAARDFSQALSSLSGCAKFDLEAQGQSYPATMAAITFPAVGDQSAAYWLDTTIDGLGVRFAIVAARKGDVVMFLALGNVGSLDLLELQQLSKIATTKMT